MFAIILLGAGAGAVATQITMRPVLLDNITSDQIRDVVHLSIVDGERVLLRRKSRPAYIPSNSELDRMATVMAATWPLMVPLYFLMRVAGMRHA